MAVAKINDQISSIVKDSNVVTMLLPKSFNTDSLCTLMAWRNELKRRNKNIRMIALGIDQSKYSWLPYVGEVESRLPLHRSVVRVGFSSNSVKKISYEFKDNDFYLYLFPKSGKITEEQVEVYGEQVDGDLIITFSVTDPRREDTDLFHWIDNLGDDQRVLNIDTDTHNTQFGRFNLINGEFNSISHYSTKIFYQLNWEIDAETATLLIKGIKSNTNGFLEGVSPELFNTIADLMKQGGVIK